MPVLYLEKHMPVRILIYDDHEALRQSMETLIREEADMQMIAAMSNAETVETDIRELKPDVVLMDIDMPGESGIQGVRLIKEARPETAVIMYTVFEDDDKLFEGTPFYEIRLAHRVEQRKALWGDKS